MIFSGLHCAQRILDALDPETRLLEVQCLQAQRDGFRDTKAVPVHHQQQEMVPNTVSAILGSSKQTVNLARIEAL